MRKLTQTQVEEQYPNAFYALPLPYQNDSCLEFYLDPFDHLCAAPSPGQESALGEWEAVFDAKKGEWL